MSLNILLPMGIATARVKKGRSAKTRLRMISIVLSVKCVCFKFELNERKDQSDSIYRHWHIAQPTSILYLNIRTKASV